MGDNNRDFPTFSACPQSTPLVAVRVAINWFAIPTPMMEPISVCELDEGRPKYHVPRFQMMAAVSRAKTIAKPGATADLQNQLHWQQRNNAEGHRTRREHNPEEVHMRLTTPLQYAGRASECRSPSPPHLPYRENR